MSKKVHYTILRCFIINETVLLNYLMIILQLHLKQIVDGLKILTPK